MTPTPTRCVVLLRGVNVGKAKRVPMAAFRALLAELGFTSVRTLLNSGNAVVDAASEDVDAHADAIAEGLRERLGVDAPVVVKTADAWARVVEGSPVVPPPEEHARFLVAFGRSPADVGSLAALEPLVRAPDRLVVTDDAAYLHCPDGLLASPLAKAALGKAGRRVTTRNWATVLKVDVLLGEVRS
jgi:uncharacterized protein (DUF1697 family)